MSELRFYISKGWPLALVIIAVGVAFYFNSYITGDIDNRIARAQSQLSELRKEISLSQQRTKDYNKSRAAMEEYTDYLFSKDDPQKLIDILELDASAFDVKLSDIQIDVTRFFRDRDNPETVIPVKYQASFEGDYYALGKFLELFEKRPYLQSIEKIDTILKTSGGDILQMTVWGSFRVFDENVIEWCRNDGA